MPAITVRPAPAPSQPARAFQARLPQGPLCSLYPPLVQPANSTPVKVVEHHLLAEVIRTGGYHATAINRCHLLHERGEPGIGIEHEGVDRDAFFGAASG